jgi:hypothetical protein
MMARNQKLTSVIAGRTIMGTEADGAALKVHFDDGSTMTVRTPEPAKSTSTTGKVKAVRQSGTTLNLDLADGSTVGILTAEETSSVMVRDRNGALEYAD